MMLIMIFIYLSFFFFFFLYIFKVVAPLALDALQSNRIAYTGVLVPAISVLLERIEQMKNETNLHHCKSLVDAIIKGVKRRF